MAILLLGGCASSRRQALVDAAREGNVDAAKRLLSRDPNLLNATTSWKTLSPWHLAAHNGDVAMMGLMVEVCESTTRNPMFQKSTRRRHVLKQLDQCSSDGQTPLMLACASGKTELVKLLVHWGADVWQGDHMSGCCAIHYAAREGRSECIKALLSKAGLERNPGQSYVDVQDAYGMSALHYAAWFCHADAARALLTFDAAVDLATCASPPQIPCGAGSTALHLAAIRGNFEICQHIMLSCAQRMSSDYPTRGLSPADPRKTANQAGELALTLALKHHHVGLSRLLHPLLPLSAVFNSAKLHAKVMQGLRAEDSSRFKLAAAKAQQEFLLNEIWKLENGEGQVPPGEEQPPLESMSLSMGLPPLESTSGGGPPGHTHIQHQLLPPEAGRQPSTAGPDGAYPVDTLHRASTSAHAPPAAAGEAAAAGLAAAVARTASTISTGVGRSPFADAAVASTSGRDAARAAPGGGTSNAVGPHHPRVTLRPSRQHADQETMARVTTHDDNEEIDAVLASLQQSAKRRAAQRAGEVPPHVEPVGTFHSFSAAIFGSRRSKRNKSSRYMTERQTGLFARPHVSHRSSLNSLASTPQEQPATPVKRWVANHTLNLTAPRHGTGLHPEGSSRHMPPTPPHQHVLLPNSAERGQIVATTEEDAATGWPIGRDLQRIQRNQDLSTLSTLGPLGWWGGRKQSSSSLQQPPGGPSPLLADVAEDAGLPTFIEVLRTASEEAAAGPGRIFSRSSQMSMGTATPSTWATHVSSNSMLTGTAHRSSTSSIQTSGSGPAYPPHSPMSAPGYSMRSRGSSNGPLPTRSAISSRSLVGAGTSTAAVAAAASAPQQRLTSPPASTVKLLGQISVRAAKGASMRGRVVPAPQTLPGSTDDRTPPVARSQSGDDTSTSRRGDDRSPSTFSQGGPAATPFSHATAPDEAIASPRWVPVPQDPGRFSELHNLDPGDDPLDSLTLEDAAAAGVQPPRPLSSGEIEEQAMALARLLRLIEGVDVTSWQPQQLPRRASQQSLLWGSANGGSTDMPRASSTGSVSRSSRALAGLSQRGSLPGHSASILDEYSSVPPADGAGSSKQVVRAIKLMEDLQRQRSDASTQICDHVCGVCLEDSGPLLAIDPCQHHLCVACAKELVQLAADKAALCPFCRISVGGFEPVPIAVCNH